LHACVTEYQVRMLSHRLKHSEVFVSFFEKIKHVLVRELEKKAFKGSKLLIQAKLRHYQNWFNFLTIKKWEI
jgi:hypothetical protein